MALAVKITEIKLLVFHPAYLISAGLIIFMFILRYAVISAFGPEYKNRPSWGYKEILSDEPGDLVTLVLLSCVAWACTFALMWYGAKAGHDEIAPTQ